MVKLSIATGSRGTGGESTSHSGVPSSNQHLYSYQVIRSEGEPPNMPQQFVLSPSSSSHLQLDSRIENRLPADTRILPIRHRNEVQLSTPIISPTASSSSAAGSSSAAMTSRSHLSLWPKSGRDPSESVIRSQKRSQRETEDSPELYEKYAKEVKWCPLCRSPVHSGVLHHCPAAMPQGLNLYTHGGTQEKVLDKYSSATDCYENSPTSSYSDNVQYPMPTSEEDLNFSGNRSSGLRVPVPPTSPLSISPNSSHSQTIPLVDHSLSTSASVLKHTASVAPVRHTDPPRSLSPALSLSQASTSHQRSSAERQDPGPSWTGDSSYNQTNLGASDSWETPTSLISRLTAGLTSRTSPQDDKGGRGCPSPTMSETSSVSMSSSYFSHQDSSQPDDPFNVAHQELLEEFSKHTPAPLANIQKSLVRSSNQGKSKDQKQGRRYTSSESTSSDIIHVNDAGIYGSQDSDTEDSCFNSYLDENGKLPDVSTLLKGIHQPDLVPYSSDKASVDKFLEPHEIGHINHLMKCVSDSMLTISLPETLYKSKGFTPLDYMDIHFNSVIRHFFFIFKNEDFLNLTIKDQIALLDGCTLRAIQCTSLYLFNKDAGFWHIPGASNRTNHPVIHVSDLKKVFPQAFVTRTYELHCIAANLAFDWHVGVIATCILMYTPLKIFIQEMDKVDLLRNKYVHLLLKYISWKHGTYNASLLFPEILKLLDAILVHVEEFASITLKLNGEEVNAVKEKLETLTKSQMAPYGYQSSKFKEKVASWSEMEYVKLGDIQNRLCMAMHMTMVESLQTANAHYLTNSSYYGSSTSDDEQIITTSRTLPQLMPPSDSEYSEDWALECSSAYLNQRIAQQNREIRGIGALAHKDLMMLRKFLEEVTNREGTLVVQNIKEKMDSNQIKKIISKLCS